MENLYTEGCIRTYTGKYINISNPKPTDIDILDIAHSLSRMPRFAGHTEHFISVAEHSVMCFKQANEVDKFQALMHDASEAYLVDVPSPVKAMIPNYYELESRLMCVISEAFGFDWPMKDSIKKIDKIMLEIEWEEYVIGSKRPVYTSFDISEAAFLNAFRYCFKM